ncbi:MFS transporter [Kitasatospora sp. NBC_01287]|uniref:MFS transporter n=1 Tax=Kitasatospora sp. NBC_01287 TaxID=2903573 RepID=UPI00225050FC|nr:MFS transporter [Kitasatospora sp. NBC_01287]MCX4749087.1 MFS transporter [Kitasatospora sp. NBC_01287]
MLDFFVVNVALPTIDQQLLAGPAVLELIAAGYGIAFAVLLVLGGRLGDSLGRRKLFLIGIAAFALTSLACGLAPTAWTLVAARVAQGASAALLAPQVLAIITATTEGAKRARALSVYGAVAGISVVVGQVLGGMLVQADLFGTSWRSIFLLNVPFAVVTVLLALRFVPENRSATPSRVDVAGTLLLSVALLSLFVPLMEGRAVGWPLWTWLALAVFPFAAWAFVVVERRTERDGGSPLVPLSLLRIPDMRRGLGIAVPYFANFGAFMFIIAITLQQGLKLSPVAAGWALVPLAVGYFTSSLAGPRLIGRFGSRVITAGALIKPLGTVVLLVTVLTDFQGLNGLTLLPGMALVGLGNGLVGTPLFRVVLSKVPGDRAGVGSGVLATTQQSSLALGVATLGTLYLSLVPSLGMGHALAVILGTELIGAALVAYLSTRLPRSMG